MDEKKQVVEEQTLMSNVSDLAEETTVKPTPPTRQEAPASACECPPGCVGLPCCT